MASLSSQLLRALAFAAVVGALLGGRPAAQRPASTAAHSVVEAERAFSRLAGKIGYVPAFLAYFADDVVTFQPAPGAGKERLREAAANMTVPPTARLDWEPWFADASAAGDLAYTTGPSIVTETATAKVLRTGWYFSIWKHDANGWRVAADIGIQAPPAGDLRPRTVEFAPASAGAMERRPTRDEVLTLEHQFAAAIGETGFLKTYAKYVGPATRMYRDGAAPVVGPAAIEALLGAQPKPLACRAVDAGVSTSGDLAYSLGERDVPAASGKTPAKAGFLHAWKRGEGGWRLAADVVTR